MKDPDTINPPAMDEITRRQFPKTISGDILLNYICMKKYRGILPIIQIVIPCAGSQLTAATCGDGYLELTR